MNKLEKIKFYEDLINQLILSKKQASFFEYLTIDKYVNLSKKDANNNDYLSKNCT